MKLGTVDLGRLIGQHQLRYLVEFGTGDGEAAAYAADFPFDHIYSLDPSHRLAIQAAFRHAANQKMTFIHGKGERAWRQIAPEIPDRSPILFLLDGGQFEPDFAAIAASRDIGRDVFIIENGDLAVLHQTLGSSHGLTLSAPDIFCAAPVN